MHIGHERRISTHWIWQHAVNDGWIWPSALRLLLTRRSIGRSTTYLRSRGQEPLAALQGPADFHLGQQIRRARPFRQGGRDRREGDDARPRTPFLLSRSGGSGRSSTTWWCSPANWPSSPASWATTCPAANSSSTAIWARPRARASCGAPSAPAATASILTATKSTSSRPNRSTRAAGNSSIPAGSTSTPATSAW